MRLMSFALLPELHHVVYAARLEKDIVVFCMRCGCYAQHRIRALGLVCAGHRQTGQAKALRDGRHPTTKEVFAGRALKLWRIGVGPLQELAQGLQVFPAVAEALAPTLSF